QVLTDDERADPAGLDGDHVEQFLSREPYVRAAIGAGAGGQPVLTEQAHHVVDAQTAGVAEGRPQRLDEGLEPRRLELPWHVRRQPPVRALWAELVGWRADPAGQGEEVLVQPAVEALRVEADGEVLQEGDRTGAGRRSELFVEQPLAPRVEA